MVELIIGVDPGLSGGIAVFYPRRMELVTCEIPTLKSGVKNKKEVDIYSVCDFLDIWEKPVHCRAVIEKVSAMPGQGVTSMFNFGQSYGIMKGLLAAHRFPIEYISPQKWKRDLKLGKNKDESRELASRIFPDNSKDWKLKKHDGRAEAALIAYHSFKFS